MARDPNKFSIDTRPSKRVVVDSLTRDATIESCIFDLIDNSIDAARGKLKTSKDEVSYRGYKIELKLDGSGLTIQDNCGGMTVSSLQTMVLRFGERSQKDHGIGVFGVGLNRALFRLGRRSEIITDTGRVRSHLVLDTEKYLKSADWNLPATKETSSGQAGTLVAIQALPMTIAKDFSDKAWVEALGSEVGKRYCRFLAKGFSISINDTTILPNQILIREDGPFAGVQKIYPTDEGVNINVRFGQHVSHKYSTEPGYNRENNNGLTKDYGWTVFCNDRAILIADQTWKTGWETKFHSEFYGFVGIVDFDCSNPALLPWSTTKTDVDQNNSAYHIALTDMKHFALEWRGFAEKRKKAKDKPLLPLPPQAAKPKPTPTRAAKPAKPELPKAPPAVAGKPDHNQFRTVLPDDINVIYCFDKQLALVNSGKSLDVVDHAYAGLAMLRMLFECGVVKYLERNNSYSTLVDFSISAREKSFGRALSDDEKSSLIPKFDEMCGYLDKNPAAWGLVKANHLKHSIKRVATHQSLMNSALHSPFQTINANQALIIRDEMLPVLRHLIET